jgi:hypothetical protein
MITTSGIVGAASQKSQYEKKLFFFNFYCIYEITRDYKKNIFFTDFRYEITRDYKKTYSFLTDTACGDAERMIATSGIVGAASQKFQCEKKLVFQFLL